MAKPVSGTGGTPVTNPNAIIVEGLLQVGPGASPPTPPDPTEGKVAGVWGYVGLVGDAPAQTSQPPISCGVFGEVDFSRGLLGVEGHPYAGYAGVVGESGFSGTMTDPDTNGDGVMGFGGGNGVRGFSTGGTGVAGTSTKGAGVTGISANGAGVTGTSTNGAGVVGTSSSGSSAGVSGTNTSNNPNDGPGVYGFSSGFDGVHGESQSNQHAGVSGINTGKGPGVWASGSPAGYFNGDVQVTGDVILVNSSGDVAEDFDVEDGAAHEAPGTVLVINSSGKLCASADPYDTRVAGVVAGAGELKPAIVLQRLEGCRGRSPIALIGKTFCKVDASFGSIKAGDLLTTSPTLGHAMKVLDHARATGAILGKALRPLENGQGLIPILVTPH